MLARNISTSIQGKVNEDFDSGIQGALTSSRVFYGSAAWSFKPTN